MPCQTKDFEDYQMKTKRFVAAPGMFALFFLITAATVAGVAVYLVYALKNPIEDLVITVFLSVLLFCMAVALFVIGFTMGAFDVVRVQTEEITVMRISKKVRSYRFSQNTQIYVQKSNKGVSQYIEVQFPEYFESEKLGIRGVRMREGYICISYSDARFQFVCDVVQNYKNNVEPIENPSVWEY